jgi:chromosomal replication initiation ATPase DnaA
MTQMVYLTATDLAQVSSSFPAPRVRKIIEEVSEATGIPERQILSDMRERNVCLARDLVCYVASRAGIGSIPIGRVLKRDHSSVLAAIGRERARRGE